MDEGLLEPVAEEVSLLGLTGFVVNLEMDRERAKRYGYLFEVNTTKPSRDTDSVRWVFDVAKSSDGWSASFYPKELVEIADQSRMRDFDCFEDAFRYCFTVLMGFVERRGEEVDWV